ncbi:MAG: GtrA family protein [Chloroflexi bacterium]|nr:GtrA family protein [Chloroflexota bacterium]
MMRGEDHPAEGKKPSLLARGLALVAKEWGLRRFVQFGLVGLSGTGVNMGTFWFFTRIAHLKDLVALIIAYTAATLSNFILNDIWTFRDRRVKSMEATLMRAFKFALVSGGAIALYYAIYTPLTRILGLYDLAALAIAIGVGMVWNFSINVLWTWRKRSPTGSLK